MSDARIRQALEDWATLAPRAGLDAEAFSLGQTWQRKDRQRSHVVLRLDSPAQSVVLKRIFTPVDQSRFRAAMAGQRRAQAALHSHATALAPRVLATDDDACICLMDCAAGETADAICAETSDQKAVLRRAGAWLSAYHAATAPEQRQFQPRFMVDHIKTLARQVQSKALRIRNRRAFLRYAKTVPDWARRFEGGHTQSAAKHGDMNLRNILLDAHGQATGIDFSGQGAAPVGFDIARFLLNFSEIFADLDDLKPGQTVPDGARDAFFKGYARVGPDDPSVAFMLRVQLLVDWVRVPPDQKGASLLHDIRFQRIQNIARIAFG